MLKIEISPGTIDTRGGIGITWADRPDLGLVSDDDWNKHVLASDQLKAGLFSILSQLGPLPIGGWDIKYYLDIKQLPNSFWESANKDSWTERGLLGPAPPPTQEFLEKQNERTELLKIQDPDDFTWIKVKKWQEPDGSFEEKYKALLQHHIKETEFLISKCQELAEKI